VYVGKLYWHFDRQLIERQGESTLSPDMALVTPGNPTLASVPATVRRRSSLKPSQSAISCKSPLCFGLLMAAMAYQLGVSCSIPIHRSKPVQLCSSLWKLSVAQRTQSPLAPALLLFQSSPLCRSSSLIKLQPLQNVAPHLKQSVTVIRHRSSYTNPQLLQNRNRLFPIPVRERSHRQPLECHRF
jgi:hypothetical protein